jgi:hypothetical protein
MIFIENSKRILLEIEVESSAFVAPLKHSPPHPVLPQYFQSVSRQKNASMSEAVISKKVEKKEYKNDAGALQMFLG